jgi:glycosyltransferase involved in cell wall biosynthesis
VESVLHEKQKNMNICLISQNASPGFTIFRKDFIRYLVSQGYQVYAFAIDYTVDSREIVSEFGAIPIEYSLNKSGLNVFKDLKDTWLLSKQLKKIQPDIVFSFFVKPSIYGTLAARIAKVPRRIAMLEGLGYIYTPLKNNFTLKKNILQYAHGFLASIGYAFADKVLFLNRDDPVDLAKKSFIDFKKFKVIGPIGLELSSYPYTEVVITKSIRFIFIARMLAEKGIYEYLAAARIVKLKYPDTEFVILGGLDPDNPSALSKEQLALVVSERLVIYPGHVSNVSEWLAKSHVFVLPSYREGFPRSTQEAMAMGKAIITTNVPGCRETVQDGKNGFLIPLFDIEILAEKMIYLIEHPKEIVRMGNESYNTALEKFDVNKINTALEKIIVEG